ncbi:hypothetical protein CORC01_07166 [Colletotrichum orchidophilum]|uniref:Uncharacterized protein n=1 Tax=Colletotrichum orchidophilum TaxID=1209926 RepID=A0A1G4B804_9PEZI|nr:uncharacterized protein CORC01_07166 [Colletotrichum orchidophilum]OHE97551.1 hypothetical protein CORC01_07166 [Colletotrichum orchidophilum]
MCFACQRLSILDEDPSIPEPEDHEDERVEELETQGATLPRTPMATKAPRELTVVQPAPSHDCSPAFAAYSVLETSRNPDVADQRPPFGLIIYDTAPGANAARAERLARAMFDRTMSERRRAENDPDRIEVVAFITSTEPALLTPRDRAEDCIRHFEQERNSRLTIANLVDAKSWFLPERIHDEWYAWGIIVIDRLEERWEEALGYLEDHPDEDSHVVLEEEDALSSPFGSFITVYWQPREETWERCKEPVTPESRVRLNRMKLELVGRMLGAEGLSRSVSGFYGHFLPERILDQELEAARIRT